MTILDTIKELQSKAWPEFVEGEMVLRIGPRHLGELKDAIEPNDWFSLPESDTRGKKAMILGMPIVCVPGLDEVELMHVTPTPLFG